MKLALGTVQFGLEYGVANRSGKVSDAQLDRILDTARESGIDTLDTAIAYGDSETRLGRAGIADFKVVSKVPPVGNDIVDVSGWVESQTVASLSRLGIDQLDGLLLHRASDMTGARGADVIVALESVRESGLVKDVGVSVYGPEELDALPDVPLGLVQTPFNAIDRRIAQTGWLGRLEGAGTRVHARSVFLQGLLLMEDQARSAYFDEWSAVWETWADWLRSAGLSRLQGALAMVSQVHQIERLVVGVDSAEQLAEIVGALDSAGSVAKLPDFSVQEPRLINPSLWRLS